MIMKMINLKKKLLFDKYKIKDVPRINLELPKKQNNELSN